MPPTATRRPFRAGGGWSSAASCDARGVLIPTEAGNTIFGVHFMKLKRLLFEVHRWLGLVLALFMLMWFVTGLVIVYAPAANQSRAEQMAHAELLLAEPGWLS